MSFFFLKKTKQRTFGFINKVHNKITNEVYDSKTSLTETKSQHQIFISCEIRILMNVQHPIIIKFYGSLHCDFNGDKNITFVMDYFENGSLMDLIKKRAKDYFLTILLIDSLSQFAIHPASTEISESVFEGCLSFTVVAIPLSVFTIKKRAFYGCSSLTEVEFQSSLKQIESETFDNCSFLTDITIPSVNICQNSFPSQTRIIRT